MTLKWTSRTYQQHQDMQLEQASRSGCAAGALQDASSSVAVPTLVRTRVVNTRARLPAKFSMQVAIESSPELPRW